MRIRTIKPDFWKHEAMSALCAESALLAIGLLNYSDDEGYFNANPKLIQAEIFPLRELSSSIPVMLQHLCEISYCEVRTLPDGRRIGRVTNFDEHQVISHPKPSVFRPMFEGVRESSSNPPVNDGTPPVELLSGMERKGTGKGNGKEQGTDFHELQIPLEQVEGEGEAKPKSRVEIAEEILEHLNIKADRQFRPTTENLKLIARRLEEVNDDAAGVKVMLDRMCAKWKTDDKMAEYLRPETLFGKQKFSGYYDNRNLPVSAKESANHDRDQF